MKVYLKYCGGCNPRYDREHLAQTIHREFPDIEFLQTNTENQADAALLLCGCSSACVDRSDVITPCGMLTVWQEDSLPAIRNYLDSARKQICLLNGKN